MKFTKIRLIGLETVDLPIIGARPSDPYICKGVDGLGPPQSNVVIVKGQFQSRQTEDRELVFRVGLNANYRAGQTVESLRQILYGLLTPDEREDVIIQIMDGDTVVAVTTGYVKNIEPVLFAKEPEVQITIPCAGSYFEHPEELTIDITGSGSLEVPNTGTAPTGFFMAIFFTGPQSFWVLSKGNQKMRFDASFTAEDTLWIDTRPGQREITRMRNGVETSLLHTLSANSVWLMLRGGTNTFTGSGTAFEWGSIKYTPLYWGV